MQRRGKIHDVGGRMSPSPVGVGLLDGPRLFMGCILLVFNCKKSCKTSIRQFEPDRIRALEAKREQRKTATIRSAKSMDKRVRRELGCTPTLERINSQH